VDGNIGRHLTDLLVLLTRKQSPWADLRLGGHYWGKNGMPPKECMGDVCVCVRWRCWALRVGRVQCGVETPLASSDPDNSNWQLGFQSQKSQRRVSGEKDFVVGGTLRVRYVLSSKKCLVVRVCL
jgi:hypothetical protein